MTDDQLLAIRDSVGRGELVRLSWEVLRVESTAGHFRQLADGLRRAVDNPASVELFWAALGIPADSNVDTVKGMMLCAASVLMHTCTVREFTDAGGRLVFVDPPGSAVADE